ncbi:DUF6417 family protein [Streptomyces sp. NPDC058469]|uniref:DUF6417 family protein n=1 Tax=Streptomyces sp. NPDC058469 TaxID=3346514 RepID=UPI00365DC498
MYLAEEQITSAAYGFYLHRLGGSAAEANQFGRDDGVVYRLSPTTGEPSPVLARAVRWPDPVAGRTAHSAGRLTTNRAPGVCPGS